MSEQVLLMVSTRCPLRTRQGTVVGSDVLPRRRSYYAMAKRHTTFVCVNLNSVMAFLLQCARPRPQSDRGKKHELGLFTLTRDHTQTLEKSDRRGVSSVVARRADFASYVLPLSIGVD